MHLTVTEDGKKAQSSIDVLDQVFAVDFNEGLIHQAVTAYLAKSRQGSKAQKTRAEVSGGGAKPWRQKGTGNARVGSTRNPIWRTGGVTFAAKPRSYAQKINRKMYKKAMCSILSELIRSERLILVNELTLQEPKTRELIIKLNQLNAANSLIVLEEDERNTCLAARNLPHVDIRNANNIDPVSLIAFEKVVMSVAAIKKIEERLS